MFNVQHVQKGQGPDNSGRLTSTSENSSWGNQLSVSLCNSTPAKLGGSLADRSLETMLTSFDTKRLLSVLQQGPGSPHASISSTAERGDSASDNFTSKGCCDKDGRESLLQN